MGFCWIACACSCLVVVLWACAADQTPIRKSVIRSHSKATRCHLASKRERKRGFQRRLGATCWSLYTSWETQKWSCLKIFQYTTWLSDCLSRLSMFRRDQNQLGICFGGRFFRSWCFPFWYRYECIVNRVIFRSNRAIESPWIKMTAPKIYRLAIYSELF